MAGRRRPRGPFVEVVSAQDIDPLVRVVLVAGRPVLASPCPEGHTDHAHFFCSRCRWEIHAPGTEHAPASFAELVTGVSQHRCRPGSEKGGAPN